MIKRRTPAADSGCKTGEVSVKQGLYRTSMMLLKEVVSSQSPSDLHTLYVYLLIQNLARTLNQEIRIVRQ